MDMPPLKARKSEAHKPFIDKTLQEKHHEEENVKKLLTNQQQTDGHTFLTSRVLGRTCLFPPSPPPNYAHEKET